jgi:hypothetical protein
MILRNNFFGADDDIESIAFFGTMNSHGSDDGVSVGSFSK